MAIKKTKDNFELWIKEKVAYYTPVLGLRVNRIEIEFDKNTEYLSINCVYPYLDHIIRYSNKSFEDWAEDKLKGDRILHEVCHILTDPLYVKAIERYSSKNEIQDEREKLTDTIAFIIFDLLESKGRKQK